MAQLRHNRLPVSSNEFWFYYNDGTLPSNKDVGKWMTTIHIDIEKEQRELLMVMICHKLSSIMGFCNAKMAQQEIYGCVHFLVYADASTKTKILEQLNSFKSIIPSWMFEKNQSGNRRMVTWNWKWKSDAETRYEVVSGRHFPTNYRKNNKP